MIGTPFAMKIVNSGLCVRLTQVAMLLHLLQGFACSAYPKLCVPFFETGTNLYSHFYCP